MKSTEGKQETWPRLEMKLFTLEMVHIIFPKSISYSTSIYKLFN
jgi:hypothetical protein